MNRRSKIALTICASVGVVAIAALYLIAAYEDQFKIATAFKTYFHENGALYSLFFGTTLVTGITAYAILLRNQRSSRKLIAIMLIGLSSFALMAPGQARWIASYFDGERIRERHSIRLQNELNQQSEFSDVQLHFSHWPDSKGEILSVSGDVFNQSTYDKLVSRVEDADNWFVSWHVTIDGRNPNGMDEYLGIAE
jgi:hypothetical protein